MPSTSLTS